MSADDPETGEARTGAGSNRLLRLEAMLIAQRKLLLRVIAQSGAAPALNAEFSEREMFQGHEEDPGVLPSPEFALEAAIAEEMRIIARELEGLAAARSVPPAAG